MGPMISERYGQQWRSLGVFCYDHQNIIRETGSVITQTYIWSPFKASNVRIQTRPQDGQTAGKILLTEDANTNKSKPYLFY